MEVNQLLFAQDTALLDDSEEKMNSLLKEFGSVYERRKRKII